MEQPTDVVRENRRAPPVSLECVHPGHKWSRSAQLGVAIMILGILAIATLAQVALLGWLLMVSGIVETVHAFHVHRSTGFFLHVVPGTAGVPIGLLMITRPAAGLLAWTALFASFFVFIGSFRALSAWRLKFPNWAWTLFDGVVTLFLGILLWGLWPWSQPWFFPVAVGASLILRGLSYASFALALRRLRSGRATHLRAA